MAEIGKRIKARREELGMTQDELAQKLGYKTKTTISKIEVGTNDVTQSKVVEFAKALNTTISYLMGWEEKEEEKDNYYMNDDARDLANFLFENPEYKVLFDASRKIRKEDIQFVKDFLDRMKGNDDDMGC